MDSFIPVSIGAMKAGMSRERLIRSVQLGAVRGAYQNGRWFVAQSEVDRLAGERAGAAA
jgi:hypothetical protein